MRDAFQLYQKLIQERQYMVSLWREVERYCLPWKGVYDTKSPYSLQDDTIFRAINILVSGLYSYLTSPAMRWFQLAPRETTGAEWFGRATDVLHSLLRVSNFYKEIYAFYKDIVVYGTACLYCEGDPKYAFKFKAINPKSFVFRRNDWNEIDFVAVDLKMSINEMQAKWGKLPERYENKKPSEKVDVVLIVYKDYEKGGKVVSEWRDAEGGYLLHEGKYDNFPFFIGQWETSSESVYASSPVINAFPSVVLLNRIVKTFWVNNEKLSNPPLDVPYEGYLGDIDISPGAINYRTTNNPQDRIQPIITSGDINITIEGIQEARRDIMEKMFVDLFLLMQDKTMTATEVIQRTQEKMLLLGSVIGRLLHDVFSPLISRLIYLAVSYDFLDEPPEGVGAIEFISQLAQSQKASEYQGIVMVLNTALQIAQVNPEVVDIVNWDFLLKKVGRLYCVDDRIWRDEKEVEQIRGQRQQMQAMQFQLQLAELQSKIKKSETQAMKNLASAKEKSGWIGNI